MCVCVCAKSVVWVWRERPGSIKGETHVCICVEGETVVCGAVCREGAVVCGEQDGCVFVCVWREGWGCRGRDGIV